jgi:hypothetical protein
MDLVPPVVVYVTLGLGAALENIVPAVPEIGRAHV